MLFTFFPVFSALPWFLVSFHFFSRMDFSWPFSTFFFIHFFLIILYGLSIYVFESIALYNFSFEDEIYKRKNIAFSAVTFGISLSAAYIVREIFYISQGSLINLFFLWLFTTVLFGFALKSYLLLTDRNLNQVVLQQDNFAAISHVGFSWSWAILIASALDTEIKDYTRFMAFTIIQIILSIIIFPIFYKGISIIFGVKKGIVSRNKARRKGKTIAKEDSQAGIYEALVFLATAYFTSMITSQVHFGSFYPPL